MNFRAIPLACLLFVLAGCGGLPNNVVVLLPDENGKVGKVIVNASGGQTELDQPLAAVETKLGAKPGPSFVAGQADVSNSFSAALAGTPRQPVSYILYFVTGQTVLTGYSQADLSAAVTTAKTLPNVDVSVVGHADATGSDAGNLELSQHRAEVVRDAMIAAGVRSDLIELAYHGSNNPLVPEAKGVPEPLNRRVEITIR